MTEPSSPESIGKYRIQRLLGSGGMGRVYAAIDPDIGRTVAIKQITLSADPQARVRFVTEARTMGRLNHPNITTLLEFNAEAEPPFLVLEFLSGTDLSQWLLGQHTLREQLQVLADMARALEAAHAAGILHRDLKPENIRVLADGHCKLLDFGIAQSERSGLTADGHFVGTPAFVAPEVIAGEPHSLASDLYALGLCCYVVLTRSNPFHGPTLQTTIARVIQRSPPAIESQVAGLPSELAAIIHACLEKSPERRPADARLVREIIERSLAQVPANLILQALPQSATTVAPVAEALPATRNTPVSTAPAPIRRYWLGVFGVAAMVLAAALLWRWQIRSEPSPLESSTKAPEPVSVPGPVAPTAAVDQPATAPGTEIPSALEPAPSLPQNTTETRDQPQVTPRDNQTTTPQSSRMPEAVAESKPAHAIDRTPSTAPKPEQEPMTAASASPAEVASNTDTPVPTVPSVRTEPDLTREPPASSAPAETIAVVVERFEPSHVRAGRSVTVQIQGSNLEHVTTAQVGSGLSPDSRFRVGPVQHLSGNQLRVTISVARGVPLGSYTLQLSGPGVHADPLVLDVSL